MLSRKPTTEISLWWSKRFVSGRWWLDRLLIGTALHCSRGRAPEVAQRDLPERELDERAPGVDRHGAQDLDAILVPVEFVRKDFRSTV